VAGLLLEDAPPVEMPLVLPPVAAPPEGEELPPPTFDGSGFEFPSPLPEQPAINVTSAAATKLLHEDKIVRIGLPQFVGRFLNLVQKSYTLPIKGLGAE